VTGVRLAPEPHERRLIVGDTHGDHASLRAILELGGAVDSKGAKLPNVWSCHIGDVIHAGHGVQGDDTRCLELALSVFDCLILGNHETPYTHGLGRFAGMNESLDCQALVKRSVDEGRWTPATSVDGFLVVHAGLHPEIAFRASSLEEVRQRGFLNDPSEVAAALRDGFAARVAGGRPEPVFDGVARGRGGRDPHGGIFWCDWGDLMKGHMKRPSPVAQIVGHTPRRHVQSTADGRFWCLDVGAALSGRLGAAVRDPADHRWRAIEVSRPPRRA
jgi:hypothetical protein